MPSLINSLTFDCANPAKQAEFWAGVLGYEVKDVNEEEASVVDPSGKQPQLLFLVVPEGKSAKNRLHFDLQPDTTMEEEVERLTGMGATVIKTFRFEGGGAFTVMQDPEGNEFCVERSQKQRQAGS